MKNIKTIGLLVLLCAFSLISSSSEQNGKYKPYTTDEFIYTASKIERSMQADDAQLEKPIVIHQTTKNNIFNSGIVHTQLTVSTQKNQIILTTETWTTKNPSYFTAENAIRIIMADIILQNPLTNLIFGNNVKFPPLSNIALLAAAGYILSNTKTIPNIEISNENNLIKYPFMDIKKYTLDEAVQKNIVSVQEAKEFETKDNWNKTYVTKITVNFNKNSSIITIYMQEQSNRYSRQFEKIIN